jgi:hypothetical protein
MKKSMAAIAALTLAGSIGLVAPLPAVAASAPTTTAAAYCGLTWGSTPESKRGDADDEHHTVKNVRSGRHECFDRLVIDTRGPIRGYDVRYVRKVTADGSGIEVPVRGGAALQIIINNPSHNSSGISFKADDLDELVDVDDYRTFRQVAWAGSFEGQSRFGLGVRAKLPFRVTIMPAQNGHSRLVVDVAHRW